MLASSDRWVAPALPAPLQFIAPESPHFVVDEGGDYAWLYPYRGRDGRWAVFSRARGGEWSLQGEGQGLTPGWEARLLDWGLQSVPAPIPAPELSPADELELLGLLVSSGSDAFGSDVFGLSALLFRRAEHAFSRVLRPGSSDPELVADLCLSLDISQQQAELIAHVVSDVGDQCQDGIREAAACWVALGADHMALRLSAGARDALVDALDDALKETPAGPLRTRVANLVEYSFPESKRAEFSALFAL